MVLPPWQVTWSSKNFFLLLLVWGEALAAPLQKLCSQRKPWTAGPWASCLMGIGLWVWKMCRGEWGVRGTLHAETMLEPHFWSQTSSVEMVSEQMGVLLLYFNETIFLNNQTFLSSTKWSCSSLFFLVSLHKYKCFIQCGCSVTVSFASVYACITIHSLFFHFA